MRELKFRVWDKQSKKMRNIDSIAFDDNGNIKLVNAWGRSVIEDKAIIVQREKGYELLQFTGLKDKNDKEIYEGDILKFTWDSSSCWGKAGTYLGYIKFIDGVFAIEYIGKLKQRRIKDESECFDDLNSFIYWTSDFKVIGNIYQNPSLLEV